MKISELIEQLQEIKDDCGDLDETMKSQHVYGVDTATAQIGISDTVDFENNTWIFEMPKGFQAGAGKYMIIAVK